MPLETHRPHLGTPRRLPSSGANAGRGRVVQESPRAQSRSPAVHRRGVVRCPERLPELQLTHRFLTDFLPPRRGEWARWASGVVDTWREDLIRPSSNPKVITGDPPTTGEADRPAPQAVLAGPLDAEHGPVRGRRKIDPWPSWAGGHGPYRAARAPGTEAGRSLRARDKGRDMFHPRSSRAKVQRTTGLLEAPELSPGGGGHQAWRQKATSARLAGK